MVFWVAAIEPLQIGPKTAETDESPANWRTSWTAVAGVHWSSAFTSSTLRPATVPPTSLRASSIPFRVGCPR